jgi:predicted HicB family RNase H-like nuclease
VNYRGYTAKVEYDAASRGLFGRVEGLRDAITFEAADVESLEREFQLSVDEYIRFCEEAGQSPERPFAGRVLVRMDPSLHRAVSRAAEESGESMNGWIVNALCRALPDRAGRAPSGQELPKAN